MQKLKKYLDRIGAEHRPAEYGDTHYFKAAPLRFTVIGEMVTFHFYDDPSPENLRRLRSIDKKIKAYAARYGYAIKYDGHHLGAWYYTIFTPADYSRMHEMMTARDACADHYNNLYHVLCMQDRQNDPAARAEIETSWKKYRAEKERELLERSAAA